MKITLYFPSELKGNLEQIAADQGCYYGSKPSISKLLQKVATGELQITSNPNQ